MADDEKVSFVHIFISHGRFMQTRSLCLFHEVNFVSEFLSTRYMPFHWLNNCTLRFCGIISITITIIVNQNLKEIYLHFQTRINYDSYVQCTVIRNQYVALSRLQFYKCTSLINPAKQILQTTPLLVNTGCKNQNQ